MNAQSTIRANTPITLNNGRFTTAYGHTFRARKPGTVWQVNPDGSLLVKFRGKVFSCPPSAVSAAW